MSDDKTSDLIILDKIDILIFLGGFTEKNRFLLANYRSAPKQISIHPITSSNIKEIDYWLTYELPTNLLGKIWKGKYRGQKQKWFIMKFVGNEGEINIKTKNAEFKDWKWIDVNQLLNVVVSFKLDVYKSIVKELNILLN